MAETVTLMTDDEEDPILMSSLTDDEFSDISQYHKRQTTPWAREILFLEESVSLHMVHITVLGGWPRDCIA